MSPPRIPLGTRIFVPPFSTRVEGVAMVMATFVLAVWFSAEWFDSGFWDWLLISGWFASVLGLSLGRTIPDRLEHTLARLANRSVLVATPEQLAQLFLDLEGRVVTRWAPRFGLIVALAIAASFASAAGANLISFLPLMCAQIIVGYIAGCYLGRVACYGSVGAILESAELPVRVMAGHLDGVGGLKPIGEFYFYQAMIVAIPAVFLAIWLLLFSLPHFQQHYLPWQKPYTGLLALAIIFEILAFVWPLLWFHRVMLQQKSELLREADQLSIKIVGIQRGLSECQIPEKAAGLQEALTHLTERFQAIEKLPVWPVDPITRRRFGLNNLALFIPVISQVTGLSKRWEEFLSALMKSSG